MRLRTVNAEADNREGIGILSYTVLCENEPRWQSSASMVKTNMISYLLFRPRYDKLNPDDGRRRSAGQSSNGLMSALSTRVGQDNNLAARRHYC